MNPIFVDDTMKSFLIPIIMKTRILISTITNIPNEMRSVHYYGITPKKVESQTIICQSQKKKNCFLFFLSKYQKKLSKSDFRN